MLFVLTVAMGAGIFASPWLLAAQRQKGFDQRKSIAETLSATIACSGIDEATKQYHV